MSVPICSGRGPASARLEGGGGGGGPPARTVARAAQGCPFSSKPCCQIGSVRHR